LRILHVIGDLAPASGGPAKAGFEMARALVRRGHEVAIYTTDFGQPADAPREQLRDGVRLRFFPQQAPRIWLASWPLRRALARDLPGFDLLHLHSLYLFHDWAAGNLAMRIAKPYLDILAGAVGRLVCDGAREDLHLVIAGPDGGYLAETKRFVAEAGIASRTTFTGMLTGQGEVVADGAGRAAPCDAAAFAGEIAAMLADPAALGAMGEAGRRAVVRRYDWSVIAERLENVYAAIVAGRRDFS
jgi:glycosyltransferase involved in cell wall biosynthesis